MEYNELKAENLKLSQLAQEAEAGAKVKSEFLATMSHEIRTPMNGILGVVDMIMDDQLSKESMDNLKIIQTSSQNLLTIINDILDFSKIEAGKLDIESYPVNLVQIVETCISIFKFTAQDKGLEILYDIDPNIQGQAITDGGRLTQIINNLLSNAIKFTEKGYVLLRVRLKGGIGDQKMIQFSILDTGVGIPQEAQNKLFQAFTQADSSTSRKFGGTGLGLAISKKLSELLGGSIGLRSKVGKGTEFYFTIKCKIESSSIHVSEKYLLKDKSVIYFDQSKVLGSSFKSITSRWSLNTKVIHSPETLMKLISQNSHIDAIVIDYNMLKSVDVSATQSLLSQELLSQDLPEKDIPWILTSTLGNFNLVEDKSLFKSIIPKPFNMENLKEVLCATFKIDLIENAPATDSDQEFPQQTGEAPTELTERELKAKFLIAEDNKLNQKIIRKMFDKIGYEIEVAENGFEVLEKTSRYKYDAIFMDMQMPELDGVEATRILVQRDSYSKRPLIIAMTANAMQSDRELCLGAGMDDYMSKPLRIPDIMRMIRKWNTKFGTPHDLS